MKMLIKKTAAFFTLSFSLCLAVAATDQNLTIDNKSNSKSSSNTPVLIPAPPQLSAKNYVLMDAMSGKIVAQKNMDKRFPPASLTKMMTLYLTFQALENGQIQLNDQVRISHKAWKMGGSRMFLRADSQASIQNLIRGIIVASGNDACVAIAQHIAGAEATFADLMNQTAARLGMKSTHFVDSTGLPSANHYSTAKDMATLARALIQDFPQYYRFFKEKWITYNHIKQPNRNRLLWRDSSVDGLKTGHTKEAGYCLVSSGKRNGMRLVAVIMGTPSDSARANNSQALLNYGFRFYKTYKLFDANQAIANPRIWLGKDKHIALGIIKTLYITIPAAEYKNLKASMELSGPLKAPIKAGEQYGTVTIKLNDKVIAQKPLVALKSDPKGGLFSRIGDHMMMFVKG